MPVDDIVTVAQAAAQLGLARSTVLKQIEKGAISAERLGSVYVITQEEVDRYRTVSLGKRRRRT